MKKLLGIGLITCLTATAQAETQGQAQAQTQAPTQQAAAPAKPSTADMSYALGADLGRKLKAAEISINADQFVTGFQQGLGGQTLKMQDAQIDQIMMQFQQEMIGNLQKKFQKQSQENKTAGEAFLKKNQKASGVKVVSEGGWQYKILKAGNGPKPTLQDNVTVNYEGRSIAGKVFDSSYQRGNPITFPVTQVVKGWQSALQMMPVGSTWEIYLPPQMAYGEQGVPGASSPIGPNQTLVFKIELISIAPKEGAAAAPAK